MEEGDMTGEREGDALAERGEDGLSSIEKSGKRPMWEGDMLFLTWEVLLSATWRKKGSEEELPEEVLLRRSLLLVSCPSFESLLTIGLYGDSLDPLDPLDPMELIELRLDLLESGLPEEDLGGETNICSWEERGPFISYRCVGNAVFCLEGGLRGGDNVGDVVEGGGTVLLFEEGETSTDR